MLFCYISSSAGTNLTSPLPAQWGDAAAMQAVAQAALFHNLFTQCYNSCCFCHISSAAGTNLTGPLPAAWGDAAAMQLVAQAALFHFI